MFVCVRWWGCGFVWVFIVLAGWCVVGWDLWCVVSGGVCCRWVVFLLDGFVVSWLLSWSY